MEDSTLEHLENICKSEQVPEDVLCKMHEAAKATKIITERDIRTNNAIIAGSNILIK